MTSLLRGGLTAWLLVLCASLASAQQAVPALAGRVVDTAQALDGPQAAAVNEQLAALEQRTGAQVAVLLVDTTLPEDIADYTQRVADDWKVGRPKVGDGVLIVVAVKDRRARIAVAKTLEGAIPDLEARRIITQTMAPKFQSGDYAGGLQAGIGRLAALIQHEGLPAPTPGATQGAPAHDGAPWWVAALMGVFVLANVLRTFLGRRAGALLTGGAAAAVTVLATGSWMLSVVAGLIGAGLALVFGAASLLRTLGGGNRSHGPVILGSGWPGGGSWGGGGGGGGGWRSGGGGDFGGGGASGNW